VLHRVLKYDQEVSKRYFDILDLEASIERLEIIIEPFRADPDDEAGLASLVAQLTLEHADSGDGVLAQLWITFIQLCIRLHEIEGGYDRMFQHLSLSDKTHIQSLRNIHHEVVRTIVEDLKDGKNVGYLEEMVSFHRLGGRGYS
jgi:hypothetical protein